MSKQTIAYLRVSTLHQQDEETIETQRYILAQYAALQKIKIDHQYEDEASPAACNAVTPVRHQGVARNPDGNVGALLLFHSDRVGRDALDTLLFFRHASNHGVRILGIADNTDTFREGSELITEIKAVIAAEYRRDIVRKTRLGLRRRAASGRVSTTPPFGFKVNDDGRLVVDDERRKSLLSFLSGTRVGVGTRDIVRRLNESGAPTPRGKRWRTDTLILC
jgi:site-specific DNA recombinase